MGDTKESWDRVREVVVGGGLGLVWVVRGGSRKWLSRKLRVGGWWCKTRVSIHIEWLVVGSWDRGGCCRL